MRKSLYFKRLLRRVLHDPESYVPTKKDRGLLEEAGYNGFRFTRVQQIIEDLRSSIAASSGEEAWYHEWCPHCEYEVGLYTLPADTCPVCGTKIAVCSMCDEAVMASGACSGCVYGSNFVLHPLAKGKLLKYRRKNW